MSQHCFFVKMDGVLNKVILSEIVFMEASDNYVKFWAHEYNLVVRIKIDTLEKSLPSDLFIRIHRSYIVAINQIEVIKPDTLTFISLPKIELPIEKTAMPKLLKKITILES